jgi:lysyl-tRNA synthetase class 1
LRKLGHLDSSKGNEELAKRRLSLAKNWALLYAGEENKISLLDEADSRQEFSKLGEGAKRALKDVVSKIPSSSVDLKALNDSMKSVVVSQNLDAKEFYSGAYKVILGREKGPRLAPLLASLGKEFLEKRFIE